MRGGLMCGRLASVIVSLAAVLWAGGAAMAQPCEPVWDGGPFGALGERAEVTDTAVWDSGRGPDLYVAGRFDFVGTPETGQMGTGVARWDGQAWSVLVGADGVELERVETLAVFDDGTGEALYAGGRFVDVGGTSFNGIAQWDGRNWTTVGPAGGEAGLDNAVYDMAVFDDGRGPALYVAGHFLYAGRVYANGVARWDGSAWSELLGEEFPRRVLGGMDALHVFDDGRGPSLFVGGWYTRLLGTDEPHCVMRWDGRNWHTLGQGIARERVRALADFDDGRGPALYAIGSFDEAGGRAARGVARWDGSAWEPLGDWHDAWGYDLAAFDDGSGAALYAAGGFESEPGAEPERLVRWDGAAWSIPPALRADDLVSSLRMHDLGEGPRLVIGGWFSALGETTRSSLAAWNGTEVAPVSGGVGRRSEVHALAPVLPGEPEGLYAAGEFTREGDRAMGYIARWDGVRWNTLAGADGVAGVSARETSDRFDIVTDMVLHDDGRGMALFVAGRFSHTGDTPAGRIARWDGRAWSDVGGGLFGPAPHEHHAAVEALAIFDDGTGPALYVAGSFARAGDVSASNVARWDGTRWSPLGAGEGQGLGFASSARASVDALAVYDDGTGPALYAAGLFDRAGGADGIVAEGLARWNGERWSNVGGALLLRGTSLHVYDDGHGPALYAAGRLILPADGRSLSRWDGRSWSTPDDQPIGSIEDMATHQLDGREVLVVAGNFDLVGSLTANNIAAWNGSDWLTLDGPSASGVNAWASSLLSIDSAADPSLWVGGEFDRAGGEPSSMLARYGCEPCLADLDGDGALTIFDFLAFQNAFDAMDPIADFDGDGEFTIFDFLAFQNAFDAGCP